MSIETATFVNDLQPVNPPSTDPRGQGDDHLRLIKQVLQNQFPNASRAFPIPRVTTKNANYTVLKADDQTTFHVDCTSGALTFTLPTLVAGDVGWTVTFIKYSGDANAMFFITGGATMLSGQQTLTRARRCIPGFPVTITWNGSFFFVPRALMLPISSYIPYNSATLPAGYEWPNGQTLSNSTNYPEYFAWTGSGQTADIRGRVMVTLDNLGGGAAGRLPSGFIAGSTLNAVGGVDAVSLSAAQTPGITSNQNGLGVTVTSTVSTVAQGTTTTVAGGANFGVSTSFNSITSTGSINVNVTSNNTGGGAHSNLQPSIMVGMLLVVE